MAFRLVIAGRPNVGKSSLFNALLGYRRSIVLDVRGTTLDDIVEKVDWAGREIDLVDAQGIGDEKDSVVLDRLLRSGDAILFVVDAQAGLTPYDGWLASRIKEARKPTLLVVNKAEKEGDSALPEFAALGIDDTVAVSACHKQNLSAVEDWAVDQAGGHVGSRSDEKEAADAAEPGEAEREEGPVTIALVGRPNVGKSTLMNRLVGRPVSRVSPLPHTTRDPVGATVRHGEREVRLVDTAGIRRHVDRNELVELFSVHAAKRQIRDAGVVCLLLRADEPLSEQDKRLIGLVEESGKPTLVLLNFWDKLNRAAQAEVLRELSHVPLIKTRPRLPLSARTGWNVRKVLPEALELYDQGSRRVSTSRLNKVVERIVSKNPPPSAGTGFFNILYASQVKTRPPTFVFFTNRKASIPDSYKRFLKNELRREFNLSGQSLRLHFRGGDKDRRAE